MLEARFQAEITLIGPLLTRSTSAGEFGIDAAFFCEWRNGNFCFPGSLIKGRLRECWTQLAAAALPELPNSQEIDAWLGATTGNSEDLGDTSSSYDPQRARAIFDESFDWKERRDAGETKQRIRIAIDDQRRAAEDAMLLVEENPFPTGQQAVFHGEISFWAKDNVEAVRFERALDLALRAIPALGANQGVGYGRIAAAKVKRLPDSASAAATWPAASDRITIRWRTNQALCISDHRPSGNIFESVEVVPGGVLKGALATQVERLGASRFRELLENLSRIRFGHAKPSLVGKDPAVVAPMSLVVAAGSAYDVIWQKEAIVVGNEAPKFRPDWKEEDKKKIAGLTNTISLDRSLRVRTKIDPEKRRAKDENLFAYEMVLPRSEGRPVEWVSEVSLAGVPEAERAAVVRQLETALQNGLTGVGKTKARFEVRGEASAGSERKLEGDRISITLITDALLGSPREMHTKDELFDYYTKCWADLSNGSLELSHFFATQKLAGGVYHHRRFFQGSVYRPWFLTESRSVFVLMVKDQQGATENVQAWLASGLQLTQDVIVGYELPKDSRERWKKCPYVPENGYGEIAVNVHEQWRDKCL
jgi:hypothetical protein